MCLSAKCYFAALNLALQIPAICAAAECENGSTRGQDKPLYAKWFEKYLSGRYPNVSGEYVYGLRCGTLHQGKLLSGAKNYKKIIFTIPNKRGCVFHNNILNDNLNLDLYIFCNDMIASARVWLQEEKDNRIVAENLKTIVDCYNNPLEPFIICKGVHGLS